MDTDSDERFTVVDDTDSSRFELREHGELVGFARYSTGADPTVVTIPHVETLPEHRGKGYGAVLMEGVVENLRATDRRVRPLCWFAAGYLRENPDTHDLVAR